MNFSVSKLVVLQTSKYHQCQYLKNIFLLLGLGTGQFNRKKYSFFFHFPLLRNKLSEYIICNEIKITLKVTTLLFL